MVSLREHNVKQHKARKEENMYIKCNICGVPYYDIINLRNHLSKVHFWHMCLACNINFGSREQLESHVAAKHDGAEDDSLIVGKKVGDHICTVCDKRFFLKGSLNRHFQIKHNGTQYAPFTLE